VVTTVDAHEQVYGIHLGVLDGEGGSRFEKSMPSVPDLDVQTLSTGKLAVMRELNHLGEGLLLDGKWAGRYVNSNEFSSVFF
jgi:hypothetical protein